MNLGKYTKEFENWENKNYLNTVTMLSSNIGTRVKSDIISNTLEQNFNLRPKLILKNNRYEIKHSEIRKEKKLLTDIEGYKVTVKKDNWNLLDKILLPKLSKIDLTYIIYDCKMSGFKLNKINELDLVISGNITYTTLKRKPVILAGPEPTLVKYKWKPFRKRPDWSHNSCMTIIGMPFTHDILPPVYRERFGPDKRKLEEEQENILNKVGAEKWDALWERRQRLERIRDLPPMIS